MIDAIYGFLKNLGFTDPLHPPIVHVPIGLVIGALVFLLVALVFKREQLVLTARHASILALVFAFPSILLGVMDWIHFYHAAMIGAIRVKIVLAAALLILLSLGIVLGGSAKPRRAAIAVIYALSFCTVVALGYFGASLIYGKGAGAAAAPAASGSVAGSASGSTVGSASGSTSDIKAGEALFENCQGCHEGGGNSIVPALPIRGSKRMASLQAFESFLRAPTMPDGKAGDMPPFGADALSGSQVGQLYAYAVSAFK
jgi:uncharacterized membrane protein